jgi:AP-2 complex subunit sigma-1
MLTRRTRLRLLPPHSIFSQIRFILLQNRQGRTRLAKYYVPLDDNEKRKLEYDIHRLVVNRDPKFTNFLEVCALLSFHARERTACCGQPTLGWRRRCTCAIMWVTAGAVRATWRRARPAGVTRAWAPQP